MADFSLLPYFDGQQDANPDVANLGELILSRPFEDRSLILRAGIHLHWALPDALTRGNRNGRKRIDYPAVPNRWLVTRSGPTSARQQWVVESDYLHPPDADEPPASITYPYKSDSHPQPFRYLGRVIPRASWKPAGTGSYLPKLTAVGYGEPAFAAFYPNCHSVFGFFDAELPANLDGLQYSVIGWYSDPRQDALQSEVFLKAAERAKPKLKALEDVYQWIADQPEGPLPDRLVCYAQIMFQPAAAMQLAPTAEEKEVAVAIGNTSTEALSVYLASKEPDGTARNKLEDQLEALHLASRMEGRQLDIGARFLEARHEKEFSAVSGGTHWRIRAESATPTPADAPDAAQQRQVEVPLALAAQLDRVNSLQQAYDRDCAEIESLRTQLFADWHKYMICSYPPSGDDEGSHSLDEYRYFIEKHDLLPLNERSNANDVLAGQLKQAIDQLHQAVAELQLLQMDDLQDWVALSAADPIVQQLPERSRKLLNSLKDTQQKLLADALSDGQRQRIISDLNNSLSGYQKQQIIDGINDLLKRPTLYEDGGFADAPLTEEGQSLRSRFSSVATWSYQRVLRFNRLLLEASCPALPRQPHFVLKPAPAPRFYQPNEPVVLLVGDVTDVEETLRPTPRHGQDGRLRADGMLQCYIHQIEGSIEDGLDADFMSNLPAQPDDIGFSQWEKQPWHPFLLEWEVEVQPIQGKYPPDSGNRDYDRCCIGDNYELAENAVDLTLRYGDEALAEEGVFYRGRSILTRHAKLQLIRQIDAFLEKQLLADYFTENNVPSDRRVNDYFARNRSEIICCYADRRTQIDQFLEHAVDNPAPVPALYYRAKQIDPPASASYVEQHKAEIATWYREQREDYAIIENILAVSDSLDQIHTLAQALSGFNAALLGCKQTLQLAIDDPLGFADYRAFSDSVRAAVADGARIAPQPQNAFNPIRTGAFEIQQLRLVDTFGQTQRLILKDGAVITTDAMTSASRPQRTTLPARLTQPARLNFRWLAADAGAAAPEALPEDGLEDDQTAVETSSHPATTPICGWLLPNLLDSSLMVYDAQGAALGLLAQTGEWFAAPGRPRFALRDLPESLQKVIRYLQDRGQEFLQDFLTAIENALESIDPEHGDQHDALALLMGRPIAVVRAMVNLELHGLPAIDHSWDAFEHDVSAALLLDESGNEPAIVQRSTAAFAQVKFPIRIGEYRQLNDGLIGYWIETGNGDLGEDFHAPQADNDEPNRVTHDNIVVHQEGLPAQLTQALADSPQILTMLVDPRGSVHATTGILPTKAIHIPAYHYAAALRNLEVTFLTAPVLTDRGQIDLPLPGEPGYAWSWLEREDGTWATSPIGAVSDQATFASRELREGWIRLTPAQEQ